MKKYGLVLVFFVFIGLSAFANLEEIDYLLFMPNSSNEFADEALAKEHLDDLAFYLTSRNLGYGDIHVFGYTAEETNDIESEILARDRALFVINELLNRGVPEYLFADPATFGSVDLWGSNIDEQEMKANKRVRITIDDHLLTFASLEASSIGNAQAALYRENSTYVNILLMLILVSFAIAAIAVIIYYSSADMEHLTSLKLNSPAINQNDYVK